MSTLVNIPECQPRATSSGRRENPAHRKKFSRPPPIVAFLAQPPPLPHIFIAIFLILRFLLSLVAIFVPALMLITIVVVIVVVVIVVIIAVAGREHRASVVPVLASCDAT
jgi:hypothetical protein